jgi:hypothetical protein
MDPLAAALEQEILGEKAATLARLTQKLDVALTRLRDIPEQAGPEAGEYRERLAAAGEALWHVSIQRELCGLRQHKTFYDFMNVPKAVRLHMGPAHVALKSLDFMQSEGL